jgi:general secretion pathway protein D
LKLFFSYKPSLMLTSLLLIGCAQPALQEFDEGKKLLSEGRVEQGLAQIDSAIKKSPNNPEYRTYLFKQREEAVNRLMLQADAARNNNQFEEAENYYRRVIALDVNNPRATSGIEVIQADKRRIAQLAEAQALFDKGDRDGAQIKLRPILAESPDQPAAKALQKRLDQMTEAVATPPSTLKLAMKKSITLEFQDAALKSVFEVIARVAGLNFVFDKDIKSDLRATIFVKNTTIEDAVKLLLVTNQLGQEVLSENTILIYPNTAAKNHDYQELVVKSFYLANADVKKTLEMIKTILKTKDVFIDEKMNLLVMRDTPDVVRMAEKLIATQDVADPEVVLEVEVLEVSRDAASNLGLQFPQQVSASIGKAGSLTLDQWKNRNSSLVSLKVTDPALALNLKKLDSDTTLLANPKIRVKDKQKAKIHIGQKLPVLTTVATAGVGSSETVNYIDVGLKLDVEPNIRLDDEVDMKVELEVSRVIQTITMPSGSQVYQLGTRNTSTSLRLKDGETQIFAGLIQNDESNSVNKVPGLGELPFLGRVFSNENRDKTKTELVLLITPRIVRNVTRPDAINSEFTSGTESVIGGGSKLMSVMQSGGTVPAGVKLPVDVNNAGTEAAP